MKQGKAGCCSADTTKRSDWARMSKGTSRIRTQVGTNGNSWKPKTCHQGAISVAVRGTFLGSAPDSWVHFLYFSHSGRITQCAFKVQHILTHHFLFENIKTMRDVIKRGQGEMSRCLVDDVFCKDDANLSANTLYAPNCKTWEVTTQTWNRASPSK